MIQRRLGWLALIGAMALGAGCNGNDGSAARPAPEVSKAAVLSAPAEGVTDAMRAQLAREINHDATGLQVVNGPGGMKKVNVDGRFQSAVVARRNSDGSLSTACVDDATSAEQFMQQAAAPKAEVQ